MTRVRWTLPAAEDLYEITRYIHGQNPDAALQVAKTLYDGCQSLQNLPNRGRIGRIEGTRELVFPRLSYIAVYRVKKEVVEILHIWHGAQNKP